jgi:hypothetical protein
MDVCATLFCVCVVLRVGSGLAMCCGSPVQGVLPALYRIKKLKESCQVPNGCRAMKKVVLILVTFVQLIIFIYVMPSFIFNYLLHTSSSAHSFVSGHFSRIRLTTPPPNLGGPFLSKIPSRFQIPAFSHIVPILSFLVHSST